MTVCGCVGAPLRPAFRHPISTAAISSNLTRRLTKTLAAFSRVMTLPLLAYTNV